MANAFRQRHSPNAGKRGDRGVPMRPSICGRSGHSPAAGNPTEIQGAFNMAETETFFFDRVDTPVGKLAIVADQKGAMRMLSFDGDCECWRKDFAPRFRGAELVALRDPFGHASTLKAYFAGDMNALEKIPVVFGGTPFQNKVWKALRRVPVGTTL